MKTLLYLGYPESHFRNNSSRSGGMRHFTQDYSKNKTGRIRTGVTLCGLDIGDLQTTGAGHELDPYSGAYRDDVCKRCVARLVRRPPNVLKNPTDEVQP